MHGIIIPPGAIKQTVDKTAFYVAKNGSEFEKALIQIQQNKPEFAFLNRDNPYRAFYDHMVAQYSKKLIAQEDMNHLQFKQEQKNQQVKDEVAKIEKQIEQQDEQAQFLQKVFEQVKEPDPPRFSVDIPEKLTKGDMAMIQHTAQYVAINGKNFLIALSERQKNNPQFEFLRSSSENHQYFTKIVAAYSYILSINEQDIKQLQQYSTSKDAILNKCRQAYEYYRLKQQKNKGNKDEGDKKKQSNIDWNDFQLVQTIIFDDFIPKKGYSDEFKLNKPLFSNKNLEQKILSEPKKKQLLQQCHICKKHILATQLTKHLKSCLSSQQQNKNSSYNNNNSGVSVDVSKNLDNMSMKRPDIFGGQAQRIRKDEGKKQQDEKIVWDGQAPNMTRTTASIAMLNNQKKKMKEQMQQK